MHHRARHAARGRLARGGAFPNRQSAGTPPFAAFEFGLSLFEFAQALFPFRLEAARDEPILGLDGAIASLGALGFVARPFDGESPLFEGAVVIGLDPLGGAQRSLETSRLQGGKQSLRYRLVDLHAPDGQAVQALSLKDVLPGAVITRRGLSSPVAGTQPPPAVAARRDALQQRAALSDGAARCIPLRPRVPGDALEVLFIGGPVDIAPGGAR